MRRWCPVAQADGQEKFAALQPRARMRELGDRRGLDLSTGAGVPGHQLQPQFEVGGQLSDREHGHIVEQLRSEFDKLAISAGSAFGECDSYDTHRTG